MGAFIPVNVAGILIFIFMSLELFFFSKGIAFLFMGIWFVFMLIGKTFGAKRLIYLSLIPILFIFHAAFLIPVFEGLFGKRREAVYIVGGGVLAFFLRALKQSEVAFRSNTDTLDSYELLRESMLSNLNFYAFIMALAIMFIIITYVKDLSTKAAWYIACIMGIIVEFGIMIMGYIFTDYKTQIPVLLMANLITLVFGMILGVLFSDIKVKLRKVLNFEDDDFIYTVICVPKVRLEQASKKVIRITDQTRNLDVEEDIDRGDN